MTTIVPMRCPRCHAQGPFRATIIADAYIDTQGIAINRARVVENKTGQCGACHYRGDLAAFITQSQNSVKIRTVGDEEDDHVHTGPGFARTRSWAAEESSEIDALIDQHVEQQLALDDTFKDIAPEHRNDPEIRAWVESVMFRRMIRAAVRRTRDMRHTEPARPKEDHGAARQA